MRTTARPGPLAMVIFGATGDLTRRKLMPALYRLFCERLLPRGFAVIGFAREQMSDGEFRERMREAVEEFATAPAAEPWSRFAEKLCYVGSVFEDPVGFQLLRERLERLDHEKGTAGNRLYYLAVPPAVVGTVVPQLAAAGLVHTPEEPAWSRVIVEKPFGRDLASARELNALLHNAFEESQIYRIDHYLGKETVQNLLVFRFANVIWEPVWNRNYIDNVQITVAEAVGVEQRAGYYERAGALRDMVQSHLLQLLALTAMEPPGAYDADSIRGEKVKVLQSLAPIPAAKVATETVRGQYTPGWVAGRPVPGYREEPDVAADSQTETFVALRTCIDNWRWAGVPFYLRTGKRMPTKASEILIQFRSAPHPILDSVEGDRPAPNLLVVHVQPDEGISLFFEAKVPGLAGALHPVSMDFRYHSAFERQAPEAYERLLLDAMLGDATLFARRDEVEAAWGFVTPILDGWSTVVGGVEPYPAGSWGPPAADALIGADGRRWQNPNP